MNNMPDESPVSSCEETNYENSFKGSDRIPKNKFKLFKKLGSIFNTSDANLINQKIEDGDLLEVFKHINSGYKLNSKQEKSFFIKVMNNIGHQENILEDALYENIRVPNKYLIGFMLHEQAQFQSDIKMFLYDRHKKQKYPFECKHPKLKAIYEEKLDNGEFKRELFFSWRKIVEDAVEDKAEYKSKKNTDKFYLSPHDYYEYKIWHPLSGLGNELFSNVTEKEYLDCLMLFKKYPKVPKNVDKADIPWVKQNSAYSDVISIPNYIEKSGFYLRNKNKNKPKNTKDIAIPVEIPALSKGVLEEITLLHKEIQKDYALLDMKEQFEVDNIYKKRLPELMNRYQSVHQKYRNGIDENGKNANDLLYASLIDIQSIFSQQVESLNHHKIEQLDISSRYIKEIKSKMVK